MNPISKSFLVAAAMLLVTAFMPVQQTQAQIFGGTEDTEGTRFGVCIGWEAGDAAAPSVCEGVDCSTSEFATDTRCISEAQAGTSLAEGALGSTGITHTDNFGDFIKKMVNFALPYLALAAFVGYVVAGFMYVTALGNDEQIQKAKKILIYATIGIILVILSYAITNLLTGQLVESLTGDGGGGGGPNDVITSP